MRSVRWIVADESLISSCEKKDAIIWRRNEDAFQPLHVLEGHSKALIIADSVMFPGTQTFITITSSTDSTLKFWKNGTLLNTLAVSNFVFDVKIIDGPGLWGVQEDEVTFFYSGADCDIHFCQMHSTQVTELIKITGHSDWVRSIDFLVDDHVLFIGSGAQDHFIRVWKLQQVPNDFKLKINEQKIYLRGKAVKVSLETVLAGHEDSIYDVHFLKSDGKKQIMSASLDKTIILWEEQEDSEDVWTEAIRVGEVGGHNLGFLGCSFPKSVDSNGLKSFAGNSFKGAVHIWNVNPELKTWDPAVGISGHFDLVSDISWDPKGNYLLSTSNDETTRLHASWKDNKSWHEVSRPQTHGYLINCLSAIDSYTFVSGADEKVLRVFRSTKSCIENIKNLSGIRQGLDGSDLPSTATVPALGLSNRAVYDGTVGAEDSKQLTLDNGHSLHISQPPTEEFLMQSTYWPEMHKLYGHGNEIFAVAVSHGAEFIASGCKATKSDQASIILWRATGNYEKIQNLSGHQLTVTSIRFSPSDSYLASVSRDRTWCLFTRSHDEKEPFVRFATGGKGMHSRIIWDVAWTPDDKYFLTVSRDKKAVFWSVGSVTQDVVPLKDSVLTADEAIMSVDTYQRCVKQDYLLALGLENGLILIYKWSNVDNWKQILFTHKNDISLTHHLSIRKIRFRPVLMSSGDERIRDPDDVMIASCGEDRMVQLFSFSMT